MYIWQSCCLYVTYFDGAQTTSPRARVRLVYDGVIYGHRARNDINSMVCFVCVRVLSAAEQHHRTIRQRGFGFGSSVIFKFKSYQFTTRHIFFGHIFPGSTSYLSPASQRPHRTLFRRCRRCRRDDYKRSSRDAPGTKKNEQHKDDKDTPRRRRRCRPHHDGRMPDTPTATTQTVGVTTVAAAAHHSGCVAVGMVLVVPPRRFYGN